MSPHSIFHNTTWKFSAFHKFSEKSKSFILSLNICNRHPAFFILIIAHDLKLSRKCENIFVFPRHVKILHDMLWVYPHKRILIFGVNYI